MNRDKAHEWDLALADRIGMEIMPLIRRRVLSLDELSAIVFDSMKGKGLVKGAFSLKTNLEEIDKSDYIKDLIEAAYQMESHSGVSTIYYCLPGTPLEGRAGYDIRTYNRLVADGVKHLVEAAGSNGYKGPDFEQIAKDYVEKDPDFINLSRKDPYECSGAVVGVIMSGFDEATGKNKGQKHELSPEEKRSYGNLMQRISFLNKPRLH